jgi:DNA-binding response OmpR family regulator
MADPIQTLIVDDDEGIRFFLTEALRHEGHIVTTAASGEEALNRLRESAFHLVIVDLKLGGRVDGLRILEAINWRWPNTAKIVLTGHGSLDSAMTAIREGVDAYVLKPVKTQQIRRTVQEVLERQQRVERAPEPEAKEHLLRRGPFEANMVDREIQYDGQPLDLSSCEYDLLVHLMQNTHRVVPPPELVQVVRQYECDHLQEARDIIKWYIYQLRRKVEPKPSRPRHILNVRGVGYTLKE